MYWFIFLGIKSQPQISQAESSYQEEIEDEEQQGDQEEQGDIPHVSLGKKKYLRYLLSLNLCSNKSSLLQFPIGTNPSAQHSNIKSITENIT